jgi:hypothetical protein
VTISSETNRKAYAGDGGTTAFAIPFAYFDNDHVKVILVGTDGAESEWTLGSEFTLSGDGAVGTGQVDVDTSPTDYTPASGETLVILLQPPYKQETDLPSGNYTGPIERALDVLTQITLRLKDATDRGLAVPEGESSIGDLPALENRKGKLFRFNETTGNPESVALADATTVSFPGSSTENGVARFSDTSGDALDSSGVTIDDNDLVTAPGGLAFDKGSDIASATNITIPTDGGYFDVTGTITITGMTVAAGRTFALQFDGALTLTHGGSLHLPSGANITTAAGDEFTFYATATNTVRCIGYALASGRAVKEPADGKQVVQLLIFDDSEDCATGDGAGDLFFRVPSPLNGWNLVDVAAACQTAGTTGTMDIQIHNVTDSVDMLSTKITIDSGETDSSTAATPPVINTSNDDVATADQLRIDVDAVQTTPAKGLLVELTFQLP